MTMRWTWHGGGVAAARAHFGGAPESWLDLSTGINPHAWPGASEQAIDWRALPDEQGLRALEQAAADHFGVAADHVCALPGTEVGLRLVGTLLDGSVRHASPAYRTHGAMVQGAAPVDLDHLGDADGQTLILANPNNPDGRLHGLADLVALLDRRGPDGWLVVDEAFADCHPASSLGPFIADDRRLMLLRSFGKFFGLAGLRLGFLVAPRAVIARVRDRLGAWPVSAAAIAIGTAAYRDSGWIGAMRDQLGHEAQALDALLMRCSHQPMGQSPLFRLIDTPDAMALFERLAGQAILTRPFEAQPRWLRIGLPSDAAGLSRLEQALRHG
ncbi:threonine-phosphate decarboxylase CobD [Sphingobium sp. AP49]|uniref:threonine-phosphate decarboxylase CobD n=1 Tax=Sphingobium sp. AP49 TaxID=1144307 RepID=UPI0024B35B1E|nr:threonine-phosphate decarboxylase CobD [Sphingobium sp. AP49]WHO39503.1 threonine-phosphate decarboxylase CobD [Sphingobium sp. AP49]